MIQDKDLYSIQEARDCLKQAKAAQEQLAKMDQQDVNNIVAKIAEEAKRESQRLAEMAVQETGFGNKEDKLTKNLFAAENIYNSIKDMDTIGLLNKDEENKVWELGIPFGVVTGIIPSTNPTSTTIFKALIAVKAGNAIVFGPHPSAEKCTVEAVKIIQNAAESAGAPQGLISCVTQSTLQSSNELMNNRKADVILATGGPGMVRAAYSSGKPAYGVGPGNVPSYIHSSANVEQAVSHIVNSKTFDYGTICSSEQEIIVDKSIKRKAVEAFKNEGAYLLDDHDKASVAAVLVKNGSLNPAIVGKSPQKIAEMAGILVPEDARVLIAEETEVGKNIPFSIEKLTTVLALYTVDSEEEANKLSDELLDLGGNGHTFGIHAQDDNVIEKFAIAKSASRIAVNTGSTFGAIGATTGIHPSLTLGCGSAGGNITTDNIGPQHLFNKKRVAFGIREMKTNHVRPTRTTNNNYTNSRQESSVSRSEIAEIVKNVLEELNV